MKSILIFLLLLCCESLSTQKKVINYQQMIAVCLQKYGSAYNIHDIDGQLSIEQHQFEPVKKLYPGKFKSCIKTEGCLLDGKRVIDC